MDTYRTTVPGRGVLHHIVTRHGGRLCLLVDDTGDRHIFAYDENDADEPTAEILMEPDEADQVADLLHSRPMVDRLLALERRVNKLIGGQG